jgi:hypothetical protein
MIEAQAFTHLFPDGSHGLYAEDHCYNSIHSYVKARLECVFPHWSKDPGWSSWALQATEQETVENNTNWGTRKDGDISAADLLNGLKTSDLASAFWPIYKQVKGSDAYWGQMRRETEGMCRVLGPPTWFLTISPKEREWVDQFIASYRSKARPSPPLPLPPSRSRPPARSLAPSPSFSLSARTLSRTLSLSLSKISLSLSLSLSLSH